MSNIFNYNTAFSRNIGWVTETEQEILCNKRIAIAGLGGVGGSHLITLTRLGIGKFNISDLDIFELANFNRQAGAALSHIGRPKADVMNELARDINAELDINIFPKGIDKQNIDEFLEGVDLYVDGLDFFALEARKAVFAACSEKNIPAVTAAPLGMGVALLCFLPGQMSFEEYFRLNGQNEDEQLLRFLLGLSPAMLQMSYLVDETRVELDKHKGPSTPMACELCAGLAATNALKILLKRGDIVAAPNGLHFDAYRNKFSKTWRPWGNNNWIQRLGIEIARKKLSEKSTISNNIEELIEESVITRILEFARWAPSGDNTQPWKFEIIDEHSLLIHAHDTRDWCVYDLDGRASQTAVGALLETIKIAASGEGLNVNFKQTDNSTQEKPVIHVQLLELPDKKVDHLLPFIKIRSTQRKSFSSQPLTTLQKQQLNESVGEDFRIIWFEGRELKWQIAKLLFRNAQIRLTIEEAYEVHKRIIEWNVQFSKDKIPDQALGLDAVTLKLMQWAMQSWERVKMLNKYFAGTWLPRFQLDFIPALSCAAHFVIVSNNKLETIDDYLLGGQVMQRFWLTSASLGLQLQPEMTPLIFSRYINVSENFTQDSRATKQAEQLTQELDKILGRATQGHQVFMGRIGEGKNPLSRSIRYSVSDLLKKS
ncbi:MAG: thiamine biosynthesis protein ThiF [Gammaproteobacteria bacterium]|nr:thiamine biosynthesis protein ThiF [Gammaproteobacteria bacterium]